MTEKIKLRVVLDIEYEPNGVSLTELSDGVEKVMSQALKADGFLSGFTEAKAIQSTLKMASLAGAPLTEDQLTEYQYERIAEGQLEMEDIPSRLARYGLMDPVDFQNEMRERMIEELYLDEDDGKSSSPKP